MARLGYQPNAAARAMRTRASRAIGFLIPDLGNELFAAVARAAERALAAEGYMLFLYSSDRSTEREIEFLNIAAQRGLDGLIISLGDETDARVLAALGRVQVPMAIWDRDVEIAGDVVFSEHALPMRTVTEHLLHLGHRRIALISAPLTIRPGRERLRGFEAALADASPPAPEPLVRVGVQTAAFGFEQTLEMMRGPAPPTAIIAGGNDNFRGVLRALRRLGLRVPGDVSLVGTDDGVVAEIHAPPVTTIERDMAAIGTALADCLLARLGPASPEAPVHRHLDSIVRLRSSTAPAAISPYATASAEGTESPSPDRSRPS